MAVTHGGNIFAAAAQRGVAWQQVLDFSASINPLGPSPAAREAILCAIDRTAHYPERTGVQLRHRLAQEWHVDADQIILGNGATDLLFDWCRLHRHGTIAAPAFSEFHRAWPDARYCQLDAPGSWPQDGPLVLTRPANPTGLVVDAKVIQDFARARSGPVLVDESFLDFCDAPSVGSKAIPNLLVLRSLTKFWALPGLRIGALIGDVTAIAAQRPPWSVNALAEVAALASIDDREFAFRSRAFVREEMAWLRAQLSFVKTLPSQANYVAIETNRSAALVDFAAERNVLIRNCAGWPGWHFEGVRVALRQRWENEILVGILRECLCAY